MHIDLQSGLQPALLKFTRESIGRMSVPQSDLEICVSLSYLLIGKVSREDIPKGVRSGEGRDTKASKGEPRGVKKRKRDRRFFRPAE